MKINVFSLIARGLTTDLGVKNTDTASKTPIIYSGQYYNGENNDIVYVAGNSSSEVVNRLLPDLIKNFKDVEPKYPSLKDEPFDPYMPDLAEAGHAEYNCYPHDSDDVLNMT